MCLASNLSAVEGSDVNRRAALAALLLDVDVESTAFGGRVERLRTRVARGNEIKSIRLSPCACVRRRCALLRAGNSEATPLSSTKLKKCQIQKGDRDRWATAGRTAARADRLRAIAARSAPPRARTWRILATRFSATAAKRRRVSAGVHSLVSIGPTSACSAVHPRVRTARQAHRLTRGVEIPSNEVDGLGWLRVLEADASFLMRGRIISTVSHTLAHCLVSKRPANHAEWPPRAQRYLTAGWR